MENFFESLGTLVTILGGAFLLLLYHDKKTKITKENHELIDYSEKAKNLKRKFENTHGSTMYNFEKELNRLFKDEKERNSALQKREVALKREAKHKEEVILKDAEKRRFGYKYEDAIFEIFDAYTMLKKEDVIWSIQDYYSINEHDAEVIFESWVSNWLITKMSKMDGFYTIGDTLEDDYFKILESDLTRDKWLQLNYKVLDPIDKIYSFEKYRNYKRVESYLVKEFKSMMNIEKLGVKKDKNEYYMNANGINLGIVIGEPETIEHPIVSLFKNGNGKQLYILHERGTYPLNGGIYCEF